MASDTTAPTAPRNRKARVTAPEPAPNSAPTPKSSLCGKNLRWTAVALARKMREERERPSSLVCDEVAADAAAEARALHPGRDVTAVERNTRRRVYDALKVMCALGCISRVEKTKTLVWVGPYAARQNKPQVQPQNTPMSPAARALSEEVAKARASVGRKRAHARQLCAALASYDAHLKRRRMDENNPVVTDSKRINFPFVLAAGAAPLEIPAPSNSIQLSFPKRVSIYTETDVVALMAPRSKTRRPRLKRPRAPSPQTPLPNTKSNALLTSPATAERGVNVHGSAPPPTPPALSLHHDHNALNVDHPLLLKPKAELLGDSNIVVVPKVEMEMLDDDDTTWQDGTNDQPALGDLRCLDNADFDS